ncbi:MAG: hypothetical protein IJ176_02865 [Prevotella sp.]|nr:hypothetical protein [Prevotella sp.]
MKPETAKRNITLACRESNGSLRLALELCSLATEGTQEIEQNLKQN